MVKNIILISIDTLRYDCIGYQPYRAELENHNVLRYLSTPTLDDIAAKSICFTQCISTNTYTTSAHAGIFTGLYPPGHGVREFYGKKLSQDVFTLAEIFRVFGYDTIMFTDAPQHFSPIGLTRGFSHITIGEEENLIERVNQIGDVKKFIFIHFFDVHEPYLASENVGYNDGHYINEMEKLYGKFNIPFNRDIFNEDNPYLVWNNLVDNIGRRIDIMLPLYIMGVKRFDSGRFKIFMKNIEKLGLMEDSLIVIFSDHGEGRNDDKNRESFGHSGPIYDNVIRVPLMIYHRDIKAGIKNDLVTLVDIFPTVINIALDKESSELIPYKLSGKNLLEEYEERMVYSETWLMDCSNKHWNLDMTSSFLYQRGLRNELYKWVVYGEPEKFDKTEYSTMTDEEFIHNMHRYLKCEFESYDEFTYNLTKLKNKEMRRGDFLTEQLDNMLYCYDLKKDPLETNPIALSEKSDKDYERIMHEIYETSKYSRRGESVIEDLNNDFIKDIAERLLIALNSNLLYMLVSDKHLFYELIEKVIFEKEIPDVDFISRCYHIFFNRNPSDQEKKEASRLLSSGMSKRRYFNLYFFEKKSLWHFSKTYESVPDMIRKISELESYKEKYISIEKRLTFRVMHKISRIMDCLIFPSGTRRRRFYSKLLKFLRGRI